MKTAREVRAAIQRYVDGGEYGEYRDLTVGAYLEWSGQEVVRLLGYAEGLCADFTEELVDEATFRANLKEMLERVPISETEAPWQPAGTTSENVHREVVIDYMGGWNG